MKVLDRATESTVATSHWRAVRWGVLRLCVHRQVRCSSSCHPESYRRARFVTLRPTCLSPSKFCVTCLETHEHQKSSYISLD